jgi:TolA-binding protein
MAETTKESGAQPAGQHQAHPPAQHVEEMADFMRRFGPPILVGGILGIFAYIGIVVYSNYKGDAAQRAAIALAAAQDAPAFASIAEQFADTPSAPGAQLGLGAVRFRDRQYDEAHDAYSEFKTRYPEHPMVPAASLCLAQCREAAGRFDEALAAFDQFSTTYSDSYLRPSAMMGRGRCLEQMDRWEEARTTYEDLIADQSDPAWALQADRSLNRVQRVLRSAQ